MTVTDIDLDQPLSPAARQRLEAELIELRAERDQFAAAINDNADPVGDVADRADVISRFDELDRVDQRIEEIRLTLTRPTRTVAPSDEVVEIGAAVTLRYSDGSNETVVLGDLLEDDGQGVLVTPRSPLGRAILGRAVGDKVNFRAPSGEVKVDVVAIAPAL
jgi:transcription elongation factor GreA